MSLKAKIEAIIYASEEPVTLQQLVGVLGQEAQLELDALDSRQTTLPLPGVAAEDESAEDEAGDEDALNAETLEAPEPAAPEPLSEESADAEASLAPVDTTAPLTVESALVDEAFRESDESLASPANTPHSEESAESGEIAPEPGDSVSTSADLEPDAGFRESADALASPAQTPHAEASAEGGEIAPESPAELSEAELKRRQKDREKRLRDYIRSVLDELMGDYQRGDRGLEIREVANGFRFATKPEFHDAVRGFVRSLKPPLKLSIQALETLAVVAYRQPVTAPEVSEIRGVDSGGVLGSLLTRKLVTTAGRKQVIGRPILYKTTKEFLLRFGLKDLSELPSIEEFDRIAGELNEAIQEEMPMAPTDPNAQTTANAISESAAPTETPGARGEGRSLETSPDDAGRSAGDLEQASDLPSGRDVHGDQADGTPIDDLDPEPDHSSE